MTPRCAPSSASSRRLASQPTSGSTTSATLALRQGMPLHAVSEMLGHSDPTMTLRRYAHVLENMEDEGGRAMDELF